MTSSISAYLSTCQHVYFYTCVPVCLPICLLLSVNKSTYQTAYLSICLLFLFTSLPAYPSKCLPVSLNPSLSIYLSKCQHVCLSICICLSVESVNPLVYLPTYHLCINIRKIVNVYESIIVISNDNFVPQNVYFFNFLPNPNQHVSPSLRIGCVLSKSNRMLRSC